MSALLVAAREYFQATEQAFWRWTDGGTVLAWDQGETIAFLPEVQAIVERMAERGLPPFPSVVLALAACRGGSAELLERLDVDRHLEFVGSSVVLSRLAQIQALPAALRSDVKSKTALLDAIFEQSSERISAGRSSEILQGLQMLAPLDLTHLSSTIRTPSERFIALRSLNQAFRTFDPQNWELQSKTGLEALPDKAEIGTPLNERVRQLLTALQDDEELSGVARLAQNLLAAVYVPRPVSSREHLPVGGVSDITNRGPLDRLLLSELAHDDLTLSVRVALNEALYLRREAPPRNPPNVRYLLLDSGLRLWGLPRVYALAVALALAATTDKQSAIHVFQTANGGLKPVDPASRAGVLDALQTLTATIHPGEQLVEFVDQLETSEAAVDAILITSDDTLDDPDFQRVLAKANQPLLAATVNRAGAYVLWAVTRRERKQVASAQLDIHEIYHRAGRLKVDASTGDLPAILSLPKFPLLLPHPRPHRNQTRYFPERGVLSVTHDGRLMLWERAGWGGRQLTDSIPGKAPVWMSLSGDLACVALQPTSSGPLRLLTSNLVSGEGPFVQDVLSITQSPLRAFEHRGQLFLLVDRWMHVLDMQTGQVLAKEQLSPSLTPHFGRVFVKAHGQWAVCSYDGHRIRFDVVRLGPENTCPKRLIGLVDCEGQDGPVAITDNAGVFSTVTGQLVERCSVSIQPPLILSEVSHAGRRAVLAHQRGNILVDLQTGLATPCLNDYRAQLEPDADRRVSERTLRIHFAGVFINRKGRLSLMSRKGQALEIDLYSGQDRLLLTSGLDDRWPGTSQADFKPCRGKEGTRFAMQVAHGPNGQTVFLDSRGLLHLRPADHNEPEVTLVLCEGTIAGWNSLQQMTGPAYFTGDAPQTPAREFFQHIDRFATAWR